MTLRWRVVVALAAAVIVAVTAVALVAFALLASELEDATRRTASEEARAAEALARAELDGPAPPGVQALARELDAIGRFEVVVVAGGVTGSSLQGLDRRDLAVDRPGQPELSRVRTGDPPRDWLVSVVSPTPSTRLHLFFPLDELERHVAIAGRVIALTALAVGVAGIGVSWVVGRRVLAPIERTAAGARRLAAGALNTRVPDDGDPSDLTSTFNEMAAALEQTVRRLEEAADAQRRFVADVSHELRTPTTALSTAADLVEPQLERLDGSARRAGELLLTEVRALRSLVEDLMEISRLDAEEPAVDPGAVDLAALLPKVVARRALARHVAVRADPGVVVAADPRRVAAIVGNLVENAVEHGEPPVELTCVVDGDAVVIDVVDRGPGVAPADREQVFERSTTRDRARTRRGGSGLGLASARRNARSLGGDVTVVDGAATTFRVRLPRWQDDPDQDTSDARVHSSP